MVKREKEHRPACVLDCQAAYPHLRAEGKEVRLDLLASRVILALKLGAPEELVVLCIAMLGLPHNKHHQLQRQAPCMHSASQVCVCARTRSCGVCTQSPGSSAGSARRRARW